MASVAHVAAVATATSHMTPCALATQGVRDAAAAAATAASWSEATVRESM